MASHHQTPTAADLVTEAGGLGTGFGIILVALFPFAVPGLLLGILLLLPLAPLALLLPAIWLLRRRRTDKRVGITAPRLAGKPHRLSPSSTAKSQSRMPTEGNLQT